MSHNPITGDAIRTKSGDQKKYDDGWDRIFGYDYCARCDYKVLNHTEGHCYMFREKPPMPCVQYKESK